MVRTRESRSTGEEENTGVTPDMSENRLTVLSEDLIKEYVTEEENLSFVELLSLI